MWSSTLTLAKEGRFSRPKSLLEIADDKALRGSVGDENGSEGEGTKTKCDAAMIDGKADRTSPRLENASG